MRAGDGKDRQSSGCFNEIFRIVQNIPNDQKQHQRHHDGENDPSLGQQISTAAFNVGTTREAKNAGRRNCQRRHQNAKLDLAEITEQYDANADYSADGD